MAEYDTSQGPIPPTRGNETSAEQAPSGNNEAQTEGFSAAGNYAQTEQFASAGNYAQTEEFSVTGNYAQTEPSQAAQEYARTQGYDSTGGSSQSGYSQYVGSQGGSTAGAYSQGYARTQGYDSFRGAGVSESYEAPQASAYAADNYTMGSSRRKPESIPTSPQVPNPGAGGKKAPTRRSIFFTALIAMLIGLFAGGIIMNQLFGRTASTPSLSTGSDGTIAINSSDEDASLSEAVSAKVLPSVVSIDVYSDVSTYSFGFGDNSESSSQMSGLGSGVIISEDGYILTNYHVIEGSNGLVVNIGNTAYDAKVVGTDSESDLAVIKVDASGLTPVEVGSSSDLVVGQWVLAAGSPFGLEKSVSTGIVSALYRSTSMQNDTGISIYANMIQTDAAINPGNSGGGLFNSEGKLIGINTLIESYSGSSSGVGFAIPVDYAMNIAEQLKNGEEAKHAYLGVSLGTVTSQNAQRYNTSATSGAYVGEVEKGSAAEGAGLEVGDVITSINGNEVASASEAIIQVRACSPGDTISIEYVRGKDTKTCEATLGETTASSKGTSNSQNSPGQNQQQAPNGNSGNGDYGNGFSLDDLFNR